MTCQMYLLRSSAIAIFLLAAVTPSNGQECIDAKYKATGHLDDVVSLMHMASVPVRRSQQAQTDEEKPAGESDTQQISDTDESSLMGLDTQFSKPSSSKSNSSSSSSKSSSTSSSVSSSSSGNLQKGENSMMASMWQICGVLFTLTIIGLVVPCLPKQSLSKLWATYTEDKNTRMLLYPAQCFTTQYLNRLMLMIGAAILLNAGLSFVHLFMPDNAAGWGLWQVMLFTLIAVLIMIGFAFGFAKLKDCILESRLEEDKKTKKAGYDAMDQLLTQTENIIMTVNGSILATVWLIRYPIPPHVPFWAPCLIFFCTVWVFIFFEGLKRLCTNDAKAACSRIFDAINGVIFGSFTFILVGFMVADVRMLAGLSKGERPEMLLAIVCLMASLVVVFASPPLRSLRCCCRCRQRACCWCQNEDLDKEDEKAAEDAKAGTVNVKKHAPFQVGTMYGVKSLQMLNMIFLFTTGTIIFQILTMTDEYQANVWILSFLFILTGAAVLVLIPFTLEKITTAYSCMSCLGEDVINETTNMLTTLTGWLAGKMIGACFALVIVGVPRLVWLPLGIGFLLLAMLAELARQKIYGCMEDAEKKSLDPAKDDQ